MRLGETIYQLRTEKGMSQGDLAEALSVSRQSVSKWETDGATPDLEKLIKLSELFGISLDTLVKGSETAPDANPTAQLQPEPQVIYVERTENATPPRKIAGFALFGLAILVILLCSILGGLLAGLLFSLPFWVCGCICFLFKKRVALWCSWSLFFLADTFLHFATGSASGSFLGVLRGVLQGYLNNHVTLWVSLTALLVLLVLVVCTIRSYRDKVLEPSKQVTRRMILLVLGLALLYVVPYGISMILQPYAVDGQSIYLITRIIQVMGIVQQWCRIPLFCRLVIDLLALRRWRKRKEKEC